MRSWRAHLFVFFIVGLHTLSPFYAFVTRGQNPDLRTAILSLQALESGCFSDGERFQRALGGSIMSLRALAGLSYVIMGEKSSSTHDDSSTVIVVVNSPFILSRTPQYFQPLPSACCLQARNSSLYISLDLPPDIPPPIVFS